jgi:hypothetical protein
MTKKAGNLVAAVTDAARRIYRVLHSGFEEGVYHQTMAIELRTLGLSYQVERSVEVRRAKPWFI